MHVAGDNAKAGVAQAVARHFRSYFMRSRPDWNRMGPPLPLWFRRRLARLDDKLVLQYIPPKTRDGGGVNPSVFPKGVWYICGKMKHGKKWISKRAVFALVDGSGNPVRPTYDLIRILRAAKAERRSQQASVLEEQFERSLEYAANEKDVAAREKLMERVAVTMSRMGMRSSMRPKILNPGLPVAAM